MVHRDIALLSLCLSLATRTPTSSPPACAAPANTAIVRRQLGLHAVHDGADPAGKRGEGLGGFFDSRVRTTYQRCYSRDQTGPPSQQQRPAPKIRQPVFSKKESSTDLMNLNIKHTRGICTKHRRKGAGGGAWMFFRQLFQP